MVRSWTDVPGYPGRVTVSDSAVPSEAPVKPPVDFRLLLIVMLGLAGIVALTTGGFTIARSVGYVTLGVCLLAVAALLSWETPDAPPAESVR